MERCCQRNRHSTSRLIPLEVFLMEEGCGAFHVAQSMPRVAVGVSREAEPRAAVDWDYKGAIKGRSILEKDCSCKNFIWDFVWVLHLEFHSNLYYSAIMYLLWETMQNENQKISVASSFNTRKFRIILPWSFQHERVRCSSALAALQSSWEVNCSPLLESSPHRQCPDPSSPESWSQPRGTTNPARNWHSQTSSPTSIPQHFPHLLNFLLSPDNSRLDKSCCGQPLNPFGCREDKEYFLAPAGKQLRLHHTKNSAVDAEHVMLPAHVGETAWELGMPCLEWLSHTSLGRLLGISWQVVLWGHSRNLSGISDL